MSKGRASAKGILFLLLIIVIVAGVVLAIIFWPRRPDDIKSSLNEQTSKILSEDGEFIKTLDQFGEYATTFVNSNQQTKNEYNGVMEIYKSLSQYFSFMAYTFENADFSKYEKKDVKNAQSGMNDAKTTIEGITKFIKEKNTSLTADGHNTRVYQIADAKLVWQNEKADIKKTFECYQKATENLAKIYRNNIKKGVYANEFAYQFVDGVGYYMSYFASSFKNLNTNAYYNMTTKFSNYIENYISTKAQQRLVAKYLISSNLQSQAEMLKKFNGKFENYSLATLVKKGFTYDASQFNDEQKTNITSAIKFYNGEVTL